MFYCNDCAKKNGYPESLCKSIGLCEICGEHKVCNDRPCSSLPMPTLKGELGLDMNPVGIPKRKFSVDELYKFIVEAEKSGLKPANGSKFTLEEVEESYRKAEMADHIISIKKTPEHPYPIIDVPASGNPEWMGGARTLAFVYSKNNGNFILRGYYTEVREYLAKNYTHYFVNYTLWAHGEHRDIWDFWKDSVGIFTPTKKKRNWKYQVRRYSNSYLNDYDMSAKEIVDMKVENEKKTLKFKRLPKRWIPEFDQL